MDYTYTISLIQSVLMPLCVFLLLLTFAMVRGRRAITSLILGLYLALLISLKFPYHQQITEYAGGVSEKWVAILLFALFATLSGLLMDRLLFYRPDETAFGGMGKKILLALSGTILVMVYSYHVLPITTLVDMGEPAHALFAQGHYFFWWLILPLIVLFFIV